MVLIQNSSADRLGLNPVGLTKWEKHFASVWLGHNLLCISFGKKCLGQSGALVNLVVQADGRLSKTTQGTN